MKRANVCKRYHSSQTDCSLIHLCMCHPRLVLECKDTEDIATDICRYTYRNQNRSHKSICDSDDSGDDSEDAYTSRLPSAL